jgi:putative ABC transport system permease protein
LTTLDHILGKVSGAMRFAALFTIVTGLAVLASAVLGSRSQRLRESILLKTLGAPRGQIVKIIIAEYLFLGAIAGAAGACLGLMAALGLGYYFFGIVAAISLAPVAGILTAIVAATVAAGAIGCWGVFRRSPLEALRASGLRRLVNSRPHERNFRMFPIGAGLKPAPTIHARIFRSGAIMATKNPTACRQASRPNAMS